MHARLQVDKYTYSVCPFKDAFQKEGGSRTSLGTWAGLADDSTVMKFTEGQGCWQGPARSMTVRPIGCCMLLRVHGSSNAISMWVVAMGQGQLKHQNHQ